MTTYYVDSAGSNTSPYDTWAKAANSIATIAAIDAAGDTIYVASTHSESGAITSLAFAGTLTSPTRIICADKTSGAPPTTIATGASITTSSSISMSGVIYKYGVTWITILGFTGANAGTVFESCSIQNAGGNNSATIGTAGGVWWKNVTLKFSHALQSIVATRAIRWSGGSVLAGGTSPTTLVTTVTGPVLLEDLDLSNLSSSVNLTSSISTTATLTARNVTLPTNWTGALNVASRPAAGPVEGAILINGDYAATNYAYQRWFNFGDVFHETTHVMTGGSSDGTTTLAWKLVSQAHAATFPISRLECSELTFWNKTVGVARTVRLEYLHDNVSGLKNDEFWIEVDYPGSASTPIGTMVSSAKADVLQAGATNPSSAAVWNVTGLSNPNAQYVSVTFTPQMVGAFIVRVCLCKASYTVYADRRVTVTS